MISQQELSDLYISKNRSVSEIARNFSCSQSGVNYWIKKFGIKKRSISEGVYRKHHPEGDPFKIITPSSKRDFKLFGLGLGLYWGEGNKANKNIVKLGNSDPAVMKSFMDFLMIFFQLKKEDFKFHLHLFTDIDQKEATNFWSKELGIKKKQFYKPTITITGALGTYKKKSKYGVLTIYYANTKLRNILIRMLEDLGYKPM
jgi:hypothetical protein